MDTPESNTVNGAGTLARGTPSRSERSRAEIARLLAAAHQPFGSAYEGGPWALFLDDEREPGFLERGDCRQLGLSPCCGEAPEWTVTTTQWGAQELIRARGLPGVMSLDHDLGHEHACGSGAGLARWLVERHLDGLLDLRAARVQVHSRNPVGRANIVGILEGLLRTLR